MNRIPSQCSLAAAGVNRQGQRSTCDYHIPALARSQQLFILYLPGNCRMFPQRASTRQPWPSRIADWGRTWGPCLAEQDVPHTSCPLGGCFGAQVMLFSSRWSRSVGAGAAGAALGQRGGISAPTEYADPRDLQRIPRGSGTQPLQPPQCILWNGNALGMQFRGRSRAKLMMGFRLQETCAEIDRSSLQSETTLAK